MTTVDLNPRSLMFGEGLTLQAEVYCQVIVATQRGMPTCYSGSGPRLGRAIGDTVFRSTCDSLGAGKGVS